MSRDGVSFPLRVYEPSGRVGWRALWAVPAGLLLAVAVGWLYARIVAPQTSTLLTAILAGALCFVALLVQVIAGKLAHSRSPWFSAALGGVLALAMLWSRWKTTLDLAGLHAQATAFAGSLPLLWPQRLWADLPALQEATGSTLGAGWVVLGWFCEAAWLLGAGVWAGHGSAQDCYSETTRTWAKHVEKRELAWPSGERGVEAVRDGLARQGVGALLSQRRLDEPPSRGMSGWVLEVSCHQVDADKAARWLTIRLVKVTREDGGKPKREARDVVSGWWVKERDFAAVLAHLRQPVSQRAPAVRGTGSKWDMDDVGVPLPDPVPDERRPDPPELGEAITALESGDFGSVIELATAFRDSADRALRVDALRLCALARSRLAQWSLAFDDFLVLFQLEPSPLDASQLATTSVMAGELARGQAWFQKACELQPGRGDPPLARLHTGFISALAQAGEFRASVPHLEWLRGAWPVLGSTDDTRAWAAGLPFFGEFLDRSLAILQQCLTYDEVIAWYAHLRGGLDADGSARLEDLINDFALRHGPMK